MVGILVQRKPITPSLYSGERPVEARLTTIRRVTMNDASLGGLIDRRNYRTNLIGTVFWCRADLLLKSAQMRFNAAIAQCTA